MIPKAVADYRVEYRREKVGPRYSGAAHFLFTSGASLGAIGWAVSRVRHPSVLEWLTVPLTFLFANFGEYSGHRRQMHRPVKPFEPVYQRHTLEHHHFFTHDAMAYEGARDLKIMLFPPVLLLFFFGVFAFPVGALLWLTATENVSRLFVASAAGYYLSYEWLHLAYHLPADGVIGRLTLVRVLRAHHRAHHDMRLMGMWNFNITLPLCDWLFGTRFRNQPTTVITRRPA